MDCLYVQFGCGTSTPGSWLNFDASPTLRLSKLPIIGRLVPSPFPKNVLYGDIVRGLPIPSQKAHCVFSSHVLEHLSRADFETALTNTFKILKPGGRFRLVVPDLEARVKIYLENRNNECPDANDKLLRSLGMGSETRPKGFVGILRSLFGSAHLWMWDYASMEAALGRHGFVDIRQAKLGDSGDPRIDAVESEDRFLDNGIEECAIDCLRPLECRLTRPPLPARYVYDDITA